MCGPNDDKKNSPFCRLKLFVKKFGHLTKLYNQANLIKVFEPTNAKTWSQYFGTSVPYPQKRKKMPYFK